jgi:hypothetical protein
MSTKQGHAKIGAVAEAVKVDTVGDAAAMAVAPVTAGDSKKTISD